MEISGSTNAIEPQDHAVNIQYKDLLWQTNLEVRSGKKIKFVFLFCFDDENACAKKKNGQDTKQAPQFVFNVFNELVDCLETFA